MALPFADSRYSIWVHIARSGWSAEARTAKAKAHSLGAGQALVAVGTQKLVVIGRQTPGK